MKIRSVAPAIFLCSVLVTLSACAGSEEQEDSTASTVQEQPQETATQMPPIEVEEGVVPNMTGYSLHESIVALREGRLLYEMEGEGFDAEEENQSTREWVVTDQSPAAGAEIEPRSTVQLTVERKD